MCKNYPLLYIIDNLVQAVVPESSSLYLAYFFLANFVHLNNTYENKREPR